MNPCNCSGADALNFSCHPLAIQGEDRTHRRCSRGLGRNSTSNIGRPVSTGRGNLDDLLISALGRSHRRLVRLGSFGTPPATAPPSPEGWRPCGRARSPPLQFRTSFAGADPEDALDHVNEQRKEYQRAHAQLDAVRLTRKTGRMGCRPALHPNLPKSATRRMARAPVEVPEPPYASGCSNPSSPSSGRDDSACTPPASRSEPDPLTVALLELHRVPLGRHSDSRRHRWPRPTGRPGRWGWSRRGDLNP